MNSFLIDQFQVQDLHSKRLWSGYDVMLSLHRRLQLMVALLLETRLLLQLAFANCSSSSGYFDKAMVDIGRQRPG